MKQTIKLYKVAFLTISVFIFGNIQAQPGGQQGPPPIPNDSQVKEMIVKLIKDLSLDNSQEEQISALYYAHFKEARTLSGKKGSREEIEQLRRNFEKEVKSLLTKDQQNKFDAFKKNNGPKGGKQKR